MSPIKRVSKLAGVSPATVSRAFSDPSKLSAGTLEKVLRAATQLNYKPNSLAKAFRGKSTRSVLVMVPDLRNVIFAKVLAGVERIVAENDYFLLVMDTRDDIEIERAGLEMVQTNRADGVIQVGGRTLKEIMPDGDRTLVPFVHALDVVAPAKYPTVMIDNAAAAESMTSYLLALGHTRIGVLGGIRNRSVSQERIKGYRRAIEGYGLKYEDSATEHSAYSFAGGQRAALRLLSRHPDLTALFCLSDEIAIGAMRTALDRGLSLPDDLSVTGFDDTAFSKVCQPTLTTVVQPAERMGEIAMTMMVSLLRGETAAPNHQCLPTELVIRSSTRRHRTT
ncbi:MAG: LacI family transcriptional regulator [Robiginitomaculum sp.]|nr:MAG: LacI family transcriptional regulator [Robiginitomaculum sp.]